MSVIETYGKEIVAVLVPFLTWILNTFFKAKTKLYLASPHSFIFLVQQPWTDAQGQQWPTQSVNTSSIVLWNGGREPATRVEWVFNWKPQCINVWPSRHFVEHTDADGRYIMIFDSLAPNEMMGCEVLVVNAPLPQLLTVRSDQCVALTVNLVPQIPLEPWKRRTAILLMLAGLALAVYLVIALLQLLVLRTTPVV